MPYFLSSKPLRLHFILLQFFHSRLIRLSKSFICSFILFIFHYIFIFILLEVMDLKKPSNDAPLHVLHTSVKPESTLESDEISSTEISEWGKVPSLFYFILFYFILFDFPGINFLFRR